MQSNFSLLVLILLSLVFFESCENSFTGDDNYLIAKVGNSRLKANDLEDNFGKNFQLNDLNVKVYIHNWVRNQVVLQKAKKVLTEAEKDFSRELADYENSLLRYTYESKLIDNQTDTFVSFQEVKDYYDNNSKNFELKENFVKARIIRLDRGLKDLGKLKSLFNYGDSIGKINFEELLKKNELSYLIKDSSWIKWETVKEIVPFKPYNDEYFLSNSNYREIWQEKELWLIKIADFQLKDNISPLEMVESKIISILLNSRKISLIKKKEEELYNSAIKKGEIKLYLNREINEEPAVK